MKAILMAFREIRFSFKDVYDQTLSKELNLENWSVPRFRVDR